MPTEVEAKFLATDATVLEALTAAPTLGDAELGPAHTVDEVDRYLDSADGRLAASRWACRLRDRGSGPYVSLKGPAAGVGADGIHRRPEFEGPATASRDPSRWPVSEARDRLLQLSGGEQLVERVRLDQRRTERDVLLGGRRVGTLSLDVVSVGVGATTNGEPFHVVELELLNDDPGLERELRSLSAALAARRGLSVDRTTKLERALAMLAVADPGASS